MNYYKKCVLCPRKCGVDRSTAAGYCGMSDKLYAARASLHMWEEPCISGGSGSGTVFFTGCGLGCVYCQNGEIAKGRIGFEITADRLAEIFLEQQERGANNINLVTPTHYVPHIIEALDKARGLNIPILYNCGGYESVETLKMLDGYIDIYMPDFKYIAGAAAKRYSNAADYPETAMAALAEMVRQTGKCVFGADGIMRSGTLVRHLVLPSHIENSKKAVEYLYKTYGNDIYMSIMSQYTPMERVKAYPEINRRVTREEYDEVIDFAADIGVENAFVQEGGAAEESFIPIFDGEGILVMDKPVEK
ncbi:MAG: radical SAM protein [Firmicutes bacterium]|nr:radical SAM protein [Bacillota bacterium]